MTPAQQRYREYLQSPHWQAIRRRVLVRAREHCEFCGYFCGEVDAVVDTADIHERIEELQERGEQPCAVCGRWCRLRSTDDNSGPVWLEVHHRTYARVGCEQNDDLVALCCYCHEEITERQGVRIA